MTELMKIHSLLSFITSLSVALYKAFYTTDFEFMNEKGSKVKKAICIFAEWMILFFIYVGTGALFSPLIDHLIGGRN